MVMMLKLGGNLMAKEKIESQEKILNFVNTFYGDTMKMIKNTLFTKTPIN